MDNGQTYVLGIMYSVYVCKTVCRINYSRLVARKQSNLASEMFKDSGMH